MSGGFDRVEWPHTFRMATWKTEVRARISSVWDVTESMPEACWKWTQARERVDCASRRRQEKRHTSHNYSQEAEDREQVVRGGEATRLAAKTAAEAVLKKEARWSSDALIGYVRANMENPVWVSELSEVGAVEYETQHGQGTRLGDKDRHYAARRYHDRLGTAIGIQTVSI